MMEEDEDLRDIVEDPLQIATDLCRRLNYEHERTRGGDRTIRDKSRGRLEASHRLRDSLRKESGVRCCEYDWEWVGRCKYHEAPGVYRKNL